MELRRYQYDIGQGINYNYMALSHMMNHIHIPLMEEPEYSHIRSWNERVNSRRSGARGSGVGDDNEEEDEDYFILFNFICVVCLKTIFILHGLFYLFGLIFEQLVIRIFNLFSFFY